MGEKSGEIEYGRTVGIFVNHGCEFVHANWNTGTYMIINLAYSRQVFKVAKSMKPKNKRYKKR